MKTGKKTFESELGEYNPVISDGHYMYLTGASGIRAFEHETRGRAAPRGEAPAEAERHRQEAAHRAKRKRQEAAHREAQQKQRKAAAERRRARRSRAATKSRKGGADKGKGEQAAAAERRVGPRWRW